MTGRTVAPRPLRQFYGERAPVYVSGDPDDVVVPWRRHRERFATELRDLTSEDWYRPTRCDGWDARQVVNHLATADDFWMASLLGASAGVPTEFLRDFDPTSSPGQIIEPMAEDTPDMVLERFEAGTTAFIEVAEGLETAHWSETAESPLGHVPARLALAHAHWDSWLHERDILLPLGREPERDPDEVLIATWYALAAAGLQGGLVGDFGDAADGPTEPIDAVLSFADLPARSLRLRVTDTAHIDVSPPDPSAQSAGSAVELVEAFTGRRPVADLPLDQPVLDHLGRAGQIL